MKEQTVDFIYMGVRLGGDLKKEYCFFNTHSNRVERYKKKLLSYLSVGNVCAVVKTETGVKEPYQYIGNVSDQLYPEQLDNVLEWSSSERADLERVKSISEAKKDHSDSVNSMIEKLRNSTMYLSPLQRRNFALWVYNQISK